MIIEFEMNEIMPACVMEKVHEQRVKEIRIQEEFERIAEEKRKEEERKKEEEYLRQSASKILNSKLIPAINHALKEKGFCCLTIGNLNNKIDEANINFYHCSYKSDYWNMIDNLPNTFVFKFLIEQYQKAGYRIGGYGTYSAQYYKDEERIIFAEPNCETCEI